MRRQRDPESSSGKEPIISEISTIAINWRKWWMLIPEIVAFVCAGALPILIVANVLSRYTDWYRAPWINDVVQMLFVWVIFVGGALAVKYEAHVKMGMLVERIMGQGIAGRLWDLVLRLSPAVMGLIVLVLGYRAVQLDMKRLLTWLQLPSGYFEAIIPVSGAMMIYYTFRSLHRFSRREPAADKSVRDV